MPVGIYKRTKEHNKANSLSKLGLSHVGYKKYVRTEKHKEISRANLKKAVEAIRGKKRPPFSVEWRKRLSDSQKGNPKAWFGKKRGPMSAEHKKKVSDSKKGSIPWNKGINWLEMRGENNPAKRKDVREKISKNNNRYWLGKTGENNPNWEGGLTGANAAIRGSPKGKSLIIECFQRDNFTDQKTGIKGGKLVAHHVLNFADYPESRLLLDNLITLSEKTHKEFHKKYGNRNNTREQLNEFLKN